MELEATLYTKEEGVATLTLNRPDTLNSITPRLIEEVTHALEDAERDAQVRAVVITGAGRGFCSGADMKGEGPGAQAAGLSLAERRNHLREGPHRMFRALAQCDKPAIAAINGPCVAGGMDLAAACDIRIASERARFAMTYVRNLGSAPSGGGCYYLPRLVGIAKACELIWTGDVMDAQEAARIGFVSRVVSHEELTSTTMELALRLVDGAPAAVQLSKRLVYRCLRLGLDEALEAHEMAGLIAGSTEEARAARAAFVERREPLAEGR